MFCATFYSYKGGVGRTLALANVAAVLARRGKRVLCVDFDLEAPGLTTLSLFSEASQHPGVLEFVSDYAATKVVPDARDYVRSCSFFDPSHDSYAPPLHIDVMPAGCLDHEYPQRFARMDWGRLYEEDDGFLLMEDLRAQWAAEGYDYVLIDSRTGLTDIGGICTRQLPDAVVAVFFPNAQNLNGLKQVVEGIRSGGARESSIDLVFAASRVPRLDDEHGVLRTWLARFQQELGYGDDDLIRIEHYDSLALLDQTLFVLSRPSSGLAHQYAALADAVTERNVEDADGALRYIRSIPTVFISNSPASQGEEEAMIERMAAISKCHQDDYVIQRALSIVYHRLRRLVDAANATQLALKWFGQTATTDRVPGNARATLNALRFRIFMELNDFDEAASSAEAVLRDPKASRVMILDAMNVLSGIDPSRLPRLEEMPALDRVDRAGLVQVALQLSAKPSAARIAGEIAEKAVHLEDDSGPLSEMETNFLQLVLVAGGKFATAAALGERALKDAPEDVPLLFNTAMAIWGRDGRPDLPTFEKVASLINPGNEANSLQCLALAQSVIGDPEKAQDAAARASAEMREDPRREFSCWTFLYVQPKEFEAHCDAIAKFAVGGPQPEIILRDQPTENGD